MTVLIDIDSHEHHLFSRATSAGAYATASPGNQVECLDIGVINNMSDAALMSTERQLFDLINAAAGRLFVRLHFYTMAATPRSEWGRDYVRRYYRGIDDLLNRRLDGVIVTGAEPKAASLTEEPYWATFAAIADWAAENTVSSVFSCLAVHAAVLHMDGVARHKLPSKCFGVFAQTKTRHHPLLQDVPKTFRIPHARWNEVEEGDLANSGYSVLTWSAEAGVDCFVKQQRNSLFVHFQGHPEYETQSLLGEYRRDMGRFLREENDVCPTIPKGYFSHEAEELQLAFRQKALADRHPELFADFPVDPVAKDLNNVWHLPAKRIYRNWLLYLVSHRAGRSEPLGAREAALSAAGSPTRRHGRKLVAARSARLARSPNLMTSKRLGYHE
ncbi:homoserine O-succinyltransferase [Bradyrhizobium sp. Gha]|uniref:homoserine O-succinyltransferase MetA n=1 Tax=Bradyrhizobium sp. Gha TaxID=1855318 RepID=UPI0008EACA91|nr:homoserine O-succinyltransferase [Bradyrhizobium sp. Gha]SFI17067.1 homoserine O-succinyltransferase [Bradyrhizobium sp. Gha]